MDHGLSLRQQTLSRLINGQTGKTHGAAPISIAKVSFAVGLAILVVLVILFIIFVASR